VDAGRSLVETSTTDQPTQSPLKIKIPRRAKGPEDQPPTAVDIYLTHRKNPWADARRQAPPKDHGTPNGPGVGTWNEVGIRDPVLSTITTPTADSPVGEGQDNITVPEGQGRLTTMEVEDSDIECVRIEARIRESSNPDSLAREKRKKSSHTLSHIPPGGALGIDDVPGESIPAMEGLRIEDYSNAIYWQFAPYLEPVRCGPRYLI
jgi:hypothetical protein